MFQVLFALVSTAAAAPQLVPYVHEEIAAEPYVHQEILAEPYVHLEPALTPEALGVVAPAAYAQVAPVAFAPAPVQAIGYAGLCVNNLGAAVPCAQ